MKLYVIAGHGAGDPGAVGNGCTEAERVRALAGRMSVLGGSSVYLCDTSRNWYADGGISTAQFSSDAEIVELHLDSFTSSEARGGSVRIGVGLDADAIDNAIASFICGMFPNQNGQARGVQNQQLGNADRALQRGIPYRLVECCFISNASDITKFNTNLDAIATGLLAVFGIGVAAPEPEPTPDPQPAEQMYRVRTSWDNPKSQVGAFKDLNNAKRMRDSMSENPYKVYDKDGTQVAP